MLKKTHLKTELCLVLSARTSHVTHEQNLQDEIFDFFFSGVSIDMAKMR